MRKPSRKSSMMGWMGSVNAMSMCEQETVSVRHSHAHNGNEMDRHPSTNPSRGACIYYAERAGNVDAMRQMKMWVVWLCLFSHFCFLLLLLLLCILLLFLLQILDSSFTFLCVTLVCHTNICHEYDTLGTSKIGYVRFYGLLVHEMRENAGQIEHNTSINM